MYFLVDVDGEESKRKPKGDNKNVVTSIRHKKFADVLFGRKLMRHKMKGIQSKFHRIGT